MDFSFHSKPARVLFGRGESGSLSEHLGSFNRILVIAGPRFEQQIGQLQSLMGSDRIIPFTKIVPHVPQELVDVAGEVVRELRPDAILAMGGGSAIGLAKALALGAAPGLKQCYFEEGLDAPAIIAVPTTFSGSEQTDIWGITTAEGKKTGQSSLVLPELVIYDPDLLLSLPVERAVTSAMNAMAHLVEAVYAPDGNPVTRYQALQGIAAIVAGLEQLVGPGSGGRKHEPRRVGTFEPSRVGSSDPNRAGLSDSKGEETTLSKDKRDPASAQPGAPVTGDSQILAPEIAETLLLGAFLGGKCLREVSMSLHHKTAHVLGGLFGTDHALTHTVLLPHVLEFQWPHLSADIRRNFENVLGAHPPRNLKELAEHTGAPTDLQGLGVKKNDLPTVVDRILEQPYPNPAPLDRVKLLAMLENARNGTLPVE